MSMFNDFFTIEDLIYIPMGNYVPMFNRPYIVNATGSAVDTISERMRNCMSGKVTPNIVSGIASDIIQPSAIGYGTIINNDWVSNKKYIFLLKIKSIDATGVEINSYIQGYTDYDGITNSGHIDTNLNHYINIVIETSIMTVNTPLGVIRKEKLYKIYNVFFNGGYEEVYTQRPSDVLENINISNLSNFIRDPGMNIKYMGNYINSIDTKAISSSVNNNITTEYLSNIINAGILSQKDKDVFINSYEITGENSPSVIAPEPNIYDNRFLKFISRMAGFKTVREVFKFQVLMNIDPTIYNRFKVINITKNYIDPTISNTPEVGDYWNGQDPVTIKAYSLIENSVSMVTKYGFNKMFFIASNMSNPIGNVDVVITNFNSFINLDEQEFNYLLELFKEKFVTEIFLNETNAGIIPMHMECYIDLLGTSKINLSFAGYPQNWYTIPTFANSIFSPVVTIDKNSMDYTSQQLANVIDSLSFKFEQDKTYF